jgi:hypothetical protein
MTSTPKGGRGFSAFISRKGRPRRELRATDAIVNEDEPQRDRPAHGGAGARTFAIGDRIGPQSMPDVIAAIVLLLVAALLLALVAQWGGARR